MLLPLYMLIIQQCLKSSSTEIFKFNVMKYKITGTLQIQLYYWSQTPQTLQIRTPGIWWVLNRINHQYLSSVPLKSESRKDLPNKSKIVQQHRNKCMRMCMCRKWWEESVAVDILHIWHGKSLFNSRFTSWKLQWRVKDCRTEQLKYPRVWLLKFPLAASKKDVWCKSEHHSSILWSQQFFGFKKMVSGGT